MSTAPLHCYIRPEVFPSPFCPGCGHGILLQAVLRATDRLGLEMGRMLFASGIGCAAWIPSPHFAADTLHVTHGRPVAFATGAKLARPELTVVVISGDGDLASIGGNHLIHAARRDLDLTVICANNEIYGMTGGQLAATSPCGSITATSPAPEGNRERPFDLCRLVEAAGASYVARYPVTLFRQLVRAIARAIETPGFAFVEALSPCPTQFGRRNGTPDPARMLRALGERCVPRARAAAMGREELAERFVIGELVAPGGAPGRAAGEGES